jgi:hypothetical protein
MSTDRNVTRIVRSWLSEDRHEDADRVLNTVLDQLDTTPQRRSSWAARRFPIMNNVLRVGLVAAAVVIIAVIAINLLPGSPSPGGEPSVPQTPQPSATPAPSDATAHDVSPRAGTLEPGTRYDVTRGPLSFTFAVPTLGWQSDGRFWMQGHSGSPDHTELSFALSTGIPGIYTDPCAHEGQELFDATSAGDAEAMASLASVDVVNTPADVTVDGHSGTSVAIHVPEDLGCANSDYWLFHGADCPEITVECTMYPSWLDSTLRYWFIDVDGGRLMVQAAQRYSDASADLEQEIQQIVDSIQFE